MGQSTDAILFYGYAYDDDGATPWGSSNDEEPDDEDWEARYARLRGEAEPDVPYGDEKSGVMTPARELHQAHWARKRALVAACPVEVGTHCSGECPMYYIAKRSTVTLARRGGPARILSLSAPVGADEELHAFMTEMGIAKPPGQEAPGWWLVSDWN